MNNREAHLHWPPGYIYQRQILSGRCRQYMVLLDLFQLYVYF